MEENLIKAKIRVKQEIVYYQEVEITEEQYFKLKNVDGDDIANYESEYLDIENVVDTSNVFDTGGEWLSFEINKIED